MIIATISLYLTLFIADSLEQTIYAIPNPPNWPVMMAAILPTSMKLTQPKYVWRFPTVTDKPKCTVYGVANAECQGKVLDFVFPKAGRHKVLLTISDPSLPQPKQVSLDIDIAPIEKYPVVDRPEIRNIDMNTWNRFIGALYILKETGIYDHLAKIHKETFSNNRINGSRRNAAHSAPTFLLWHRIQSRILERAVQHAIGDPTMGLPYWDWEKGWSGLEAYLGGNGNPNNDNIVDSGPFCNDPRATDLKKCPKKWVLPADYPHPSRAIQRKLGNDTRVHFPTSLQIQKMLSVNEYDVAPFDDKSSSQSFRSVLEGWPSTEKNDTSFGWGHNGMHRWVAGTMRIVELSLYDPATFFIHHAAVDRYFTMWQVKKNCDDGKVTSQCYRPVDGDPGLTKEVPGVTVENGKYVLKGFMPSDPMYPWNMRVDSALKANQGYRYLSPGEKPPIPEAAELNKPDPSKGNTTEPAFLPTPKVANESSPRTSESIIVELLTIVFIFLSL